MNARATFTSMELSTPADWQAIGAEFPATARTLPDRVRLLREIATASAEAVRLTLEVIDHPEWFLMAHFDLDTPCEVLP